MNGDIHTRLWITWTKLNCLVPLTQQHPPPLPVWIITWPEHQSPPSQLTWHRVSPRVQILVPSSSAWQDHPSQAQCPMQGQRHQTMQYISKAITSTFINTLLFEIKLCMPSNYTHLILLLLARSSGIYPGFSPLSKPPSACPLSSHRKPTVTRSQSYLTTNNPSVMTIRCLTLTENTNDLRNLIILLFCVYFVRTLIHWIHFVETLNC